MPLYLAAIFYITQCELDFLQSVDTDRREHVIDTYPAAVRATKELGEYDQVSFQDLTRTTQKFHSHMRSELKRTGQRGPHYALKFWKQNSTAVSYDSPSAFNELAKTFLCSQGSFANAERFFSNIGSIESGACQSTLSSTVEMKRTTRLFVNMCFKNLSVLQSIPLHPRGTALRQVATATAQKVFQSLNEE